MLLTLPNFKSLNKLTIKQTFHKNMEQQNCLTPKVSYTSLDNLIHGVVR